MSYRKITVDDQQYEYVVGKTHVKVKGIGTWPKQEVGVLQTNYRYCECCGEPPCKIYRDHVDPTDIAVMPSHIRAKIKESLA